MIIRVLVDTYRCRKAKEGCCTREAYTSVMKIVLLLLLRAITYIETRILKHDLPTWCVEMRECGKRSTVKLFESSCAHP